MGGIVKSVGKVVKSVTKVVKKVAKSVFKVAKKVVKGIGGVFKKLGPLASVAMMMIPGAQAFAGTMWANMGISSAVAQNFMTGALTGFIGSGGKLKGALLGGVMAGAGTAISRGFQGQGFGSGFKAGTGAWKPSGTGISGAWDAGKATFTEKMGNTFKSFSSNGDITEGVSNLNNASSKLPAGSTYDQIKVATQVQPTSGVNVYNAQTTSDWQQVMDTAKMNASSTTSMVPMTTPSGVPSSLTGAAPTSASALEGMDFGFGAPTPQQEVITNWGKTAGNVNIGFQPTGHAEGSVLTLSGEGAANIIGPQDIGIGVADGINSRGLMAKSTYTDTDGVIRGKFSDSAVTPEGLKIMEQGRVPKKTSSGFDWKKAKGLFDALTGPSQQDSIAGSGMKDPGHDPQEGMTMAVGMQQGQGIWGEDFADFMAGYVRATGQSQKQSGAYMAKAFA